MTDWERVLTDVTAEVQRVCDSVRAKGEIDRRVGVGAAGDETLLADRDAENVIVESLLSIDGVRVLSEEAGGRGPKTSKLLAIVDPLDGSSNFSRGIPFYCTSICVVEGQRLSEARCAVVRNLVNGDVYYAEKGRGAFKNGARLRPSTRGELSESVAAVDLSKAQLKVIEALVPLSAKLGRQVHFGANALEMCMVADGELDVFVDLRNKMRITDVAGAHLIGREAGVTITSEAGEGLDPRLDLAARLKVVAASNPALHQKVLAELRPFRERRL